MYVTAEEREKREKDRGGAGTNLNQVGQYSKFTHLDNPEQYLLQVSLQSLLY